jgi:hypothetical protein
VRQAGLIWEPHAKTPRPPLSQSQVSSQHQRFEMSLQLAAISKRM